MSLHETTASVTASLEYPACPLAREPLSEVCGSDRREFPFRLHQPYSVVRCTECGLYYLYPRLVESAMQEAFHQSSYYGGSSRRRKPISGSLTVIHVGPLE
jgi:hypothetical protein